MIELNTVNKYFNRHKRNQIHAIDNTSIKLEDTGLVALLGPSGCGKTTMLNAIGGLDKISGGSIFINGQKISSRFQGKVDRIRNLNVGYIFQDYKLVDNLTVYDNISIALKMIGIRDKKEINKRIEYILEKVGLEKYKRRPAGMLSGGERQRVGIARALAKDPDIILADEPTGNLDSKNSLEVMKIIKAISKDRLVVLVTHEQDLAKFYASRIIEIQDGKVIKDYENDDVSELDYQIDNNFYLKDFEDKRDFKDDKTKIHIYADKKDDISLDIVVKNGNIYIRSNHSNDKVEVVDENSSIEFVNDSYKQIKKNDIEKYEFNFKEVIDTSKKKRYSSLFNPISLIINGFQKIISSPFIKKAMYSGFALSGFFIVYALSSVSAAYNIKDIDFVDINRHYVSVATDAKSIKVQRKLEELEGVKYVIPGSSKINVDIDLSEFYQTNGRTASIAVSLTDLETANKDNVIFGRYPENDKEVLLDRMIIDKILNPKVSDMNTYNFGSLNIKSVEDIVGRKLNFNSEFLFDFTIVGIVDDSSPSIYVNNKYFQNILSLNSSKVEEGGYFGYGEMSTYSNDENSVYDYELIKDRINLKEGRFPQNEYETIVHIDNKEMYKLNKDIDVKVGDKKLKVVGYYTSKYPYKYFLVNNKTIEISNINKINNFSIYTDELDKVVNEVKELGYTNVKDSYSNSRAVYVANQKESMNRALTVSVIIILISFIEIFLMIRSSFLSRIKEVGIYRAIGAKKVDIYKMFLGEIIAITTMFAVPGILVGFYVFERLSHIKFISAMFYVNSFVVIASFVLVYALNLIVGLLPVFNVIRKRPAEILARNDL